MEEIQKAAIKKFEDWEGNKPYKILFLAFQDELAHLLDKGYTPELVRLHLQSATALDLPYKQFREAFYRFRKKLKLSRPKGKGKQGEPEKKTELKPKEKEIPEFNFNLGAASTDDYMKDFFNNVKRPGDWDERMKNK
ncbi:hypothetical protein ACFSKU_08940 [Pontibacter silvestris]|uniref:Uncharacterized protein n=1 Tax=Pontibacter silvestris TaxID=2305183 RepID=A0ABW4WWB1_9BACT|nr:hypothetical protein [Pontibacter silvestris]MCC9138864.1 hypothetical protein [Pontibacter silvestris]